MPRKREERKKPENQKSFPKRHRPSKVSRPSCSTGRDSNRKFRWKRPSNSINKKMLKAELTIFRKVPFLPISWTENSKRTQRFWPIWSSKREKRRQGNGQCLLKRWSQWLKLKCLMSSDQASERENVGKEGSTRSVSSVKTSPENHQSTKDSSVRWVSGSKTLTWLTLS